jgi:hypothetical protein
MSTKLFKVGGVSKSKNGYKVRFATDMTRVKILAKTDSDINLMELPQPMDKPALVSFLKDSDLYSNTEYKAAIDSADAKYNGVVKAKAEKVKSAKKPSMSDLKARAAAVAE